jgi:transposase-like protein
VISMQRGRPARCPFCGGYRSSLKGTRRNKSGPVRIRKCKQCGRRWTPKAKQYRGKHENAVPTPLAVPTAN